MDLVSADPFRVASLIWQPRPGAFMLTVVCKATFVLLPGMSAPARDQDPPNETDDHWNDDERRSLHSASDLVPFKRRAEVFLVGHAYAPRMQPVSSLTARLIVGEIDKTIEVRADRLWTQHGELREGPRFAKMPLRYERAGGGPDTSNPVGVRADARPDLYGQVTVPNLQPPGFHVARPGEPVPPIGFGPIAPAWPARAEKLRGHAAAWDYRRWNERALPGDIDAGFFNVAPVDQQLEELRSDERIVMENLHAEHARLVTSLPGTAPRAMLERAGAAGQELRLRCDTLSIDTDRGVCSLVWRGQAALGRADEAGRVVISVVGRRKDEAVATIAGGLRAGAATPFEATATATGDQEALPTMLAMPGVQGAAVLPFREVSPWEGPSVVGAASGEARGRREDDGTGTIIALGGVGGEVLPFLARMNGISDPTATPAQVTSLAAAPTGEPWGQALDVAMLPMLGPLASTELSAPPRDEGALTASVQAHRAKEPLLPLMDFPIERCAAIAASTARRAEHRENTLHENELTAAQWEALGAHWMDEIRKEAKGGKTTLLDAYDNAYVSRLEAERGAITVNEYARLVVGSERGCAEEVATELTLPRGSLLRIERTWLKKLATDSTLSERVRMAVEAVRDG